MVCIWTEARLIKYDTQHVLITVWVRVDVVVSLGKPVIFEGENELCKETALCSLYVRNRKEGKLLLKMGMRPLRVNQRIMPGSKVGTGLSTIDDSSDAHAIVAKPELIRA